MRPRAPSANVVFFACVSALGVLILGNMLLLDAAVGARPHIDADTGENGTVILMRLFPVPEGSVIRVQTFGINPAYDLYVTDGAGGDALREGREPTHVLHHSPAGSERPLVVDIVRPPPAPDAPRPTRPGWHHAETGDLWREEMRTAVDVVLVDRRPLTPCDGEPHCAAFMSNLAAQHTWSGDGRRATVFHPLTDDLQRAIYALEALAAVGVAGSLAALVAGVVRRRRARRGEAPVAPPADSAEGLIGLVERAGQYLATLRNTLAGIGVLLLFMGVCGAVAFEEFGFYFEHLKPSRAWQWVTLGGMVAVYVALVLWWLVALVSTQMELTRFRRRTAALPALE